jgi:hypothetical protein
VRTIAAALIVSLAFVAVSRASEPFTEAAVRTMVAELNAAATKRQIGPWEARLAPECDISMQVTTFGKLKTTHFSRREYLDLTQKLWAEFARQSVGYHYEAGPINVRIAAGEKVAVVSGSSTETLTYPDGQELVTTGLSTMRVELREGRLMIVSITAVGSE